MGKFFSRSLSSIPKTGAKYKVKIREEERASGIDLEETQLDAAFEEILDKEKAVYMERNEQAGTLSIKHRSEKACAEEDRRQAMERLGKSQRRNVDSEEVKSADKMLETCVSLLKFSKL